MYLCSHNIIVFSGTKDGKLGKMHFPSDETTSKSIELFSKSQSICNALIGTETRLIESLSLIDAVTPDIVAARQNAHNAQKQAIKAEPGSGSEQNGVDVSI